MLKKNKNSKLKKWIEFWCVCAIIGCISGFMWSDNMVMNIIVIIISALILAIIRVVLIFYSNSRRYRYHKLNAEVKSEKIYRTFYYMGTRYN